MKKGVKNVLPADHLSVKDLLYWNFDSAILYLWNHGISYRLESYYKNGIKKNNPKSKHYVSDRVNIELDIVGKIENIYFG